MVKGGYKYKSPRSVKRQKSKFLSLAGNIRNIFKKSNKRKTNKRIRKQNKKRHNKKRQTKKRPKRRNSSKKRR